MFSSRYALNVFYSGTTVTLPDFKLRHLMPMMFGDYFRYDGSLTTPPCYQSVQWTVFWQKIPISSVQVCLDLKDMLTNI